VAHVYVLGDAAVASDMPKSAFAANSQAKVVAVEILADLTHRQPTPARYRNVCWSLLAPDDDVKLGANYAVAEGRLVASDSFSPRGGEPAEGRRENYQESLAWYGAITAEMFALPERSPEAKKG